MNLNAFMNQARYPHAQTSGVQFARAIVVSNEDPDQLGRVRVKYPWSAKSMRDTESHWARVVSPLASNEAGWLATPKPNDEVFVYFEDGNMNTPIILGMLFSKQNKPPKVNGSESKPGESVIVKTSKGKVLALDDRDSSAGIYLETPNGNKIHISDANSEIKIIDKNNNSISIEAEKISIQDKNQNQVSLDQGGIHIESSKKIELGKGAAEALVKGKTFVQLFNAHTHNHPMGPTSPPTIPLQVKAVLSDKVKTI